MNEENLDLLIEEVVNDENLEKTQTKRETYESIEKVKYPRDYNSDYPIVINLGASKRKGEERSLSSVKVETCPSFKHFYFQHFPRLLRIMETDYWG